MPELPAQVIPVATGPTSNRERQAVAARRQVENGLLVHILRGHFDKEAARIDAEAAFEGSKSALEVELELLSWGIAKAQGSAAGTKLISDRVEQLSRINSRNLSQRFGA
jgi:hypothetical protein